MKWDIFAILMLLPWAATFAGSVAAAKVKIKSQRSMGALLGFASGVMVAASVWSLILPAFAEAPGFGGAAIVTLGFALGCAGMLALDKLVPHQHMDEEKPEGGPSHLSRPTLLVLAVMLHNIPEGLASGVVIAAAMQPDGMGWMAAAMFGVGMALQNFPEGMAVVLPLRQGGASNRKCMTWGFWASLAEPVSALVGLGLSAAVMSTGGFVMPLMLSMAAGAMTFIVVEELIPESQSAAEHGHAATYGFLGGFWIMALMGALSS